MSYSPLLATGGILAAVLVIGAIVMPALGFEHPTRSAAPADETVTPAPVPTAAPTPAPTPTATPTPTPDPQAIVGGYQRSTLTEADD